MTPIELFGLRLARKIVTSDKCWEWTGALSEGYGNFWIGRFGDANYVQWKGHRYAWTCANGRIPDGLCVLHKCDNRRCMNPEHLFLGTRNDNNQDKIRKGRQKVGVGERHWKARLRYADVKAIRHLYFAERCSQTAIAMFYGVSQAHVSRICLQESWKPIVNV